MNVTLLFGVERYSEVAEAYIRGLERRHAAGLPLEVHSVASFFVSRVDTEVDKRLAALGRSDLAGTAALANARAAYAATRRSSSASVSPRCAPRARWFSARCGPRPARRIRPTPRRCTSTACRPRHRQHDADEDAARRGRARHGKSGNRSRGPDLRWRSSPTPASTCRTSPPRCSRRASRHSSHR